MPGCRVPPVLEPWSSLRRYWRLNVKPKHLIDCSVLPPVRELGHMTLCQEAEKQENLIRTTSRRSGEIVWMLF